MLGIVFVIIFYSISAGNDGKSIKEAEEAR